MLVEYETLDRNSKFVWGKASVNFAGYFPSQLIVGQYRRDGRDAWTEMDAGKLDWNNRCSTKTKASLLWPLAFMQKVSPNAASQHDLDLVPPRGRVPLPLQFEASLLESAEPTAG